MAEAETFIYASRADGPAQSRIFASKRRCPGGPTGDQNSVRVGMHPTAYPQFIDEVDVLHTGLNNMGTIFHPAISILNAGWIESTDGDFQFYIDGVTPSVRHPGGAGPRAGDRGLGLGIRARTSLEWMQLAYDTKGDDIHEAIHNQPGYYGIKAPSTLKHRYIFEDVPMSLVPMAALGDALRRQRARHGQHDPPGEFRSQHRLLAARARPRQAGDRAIQRQRIDQICPLWDQGLIKLAYG